MKKITRIFIYGVMIFTLLIAYSSHVFAEGDLNYVNHLITPTADLKEGINGGSYFKVSVKVTPSADFDLYLLVDKISKATDKRTTYVLCHKSAAQAGVSYSISFDPNPNTPDCDNQLSIDRNFFTHEYEYFGYVSDAADGFNIAEDGGRFMFDDVPASTPSGQNVTIVNIESQSSGSKHYYKIKGSIDVGGTNNLNFAVQKRGETRWVDIKTIPYKSGSFEFPIGSDISTTPNLSSGNYKLRIMDTAGVTLYENDIAATIDDGSTPPTPQSSENFQSSYDQGALVHTDCGYSDGSGKGFVMCGFTHAMEMLNRVIDFIFALVLPIAAIIFVYVGFLYLSSAANPEKRTTAKKAMGKLILGIVVIMLAWILVKTVLTSLGVGEGFSFLDLRS